MNEKPPHNNVVPFPTDRVALRRRVEQMKGTVAHCRQQWDYLKQLVDTWRDAKQNTSEVRQAVKDLKALLSDNAICENLRAMVERVVTPCDRIENNLTVIEDCINGENCLDAVITSAIVVIEQSFDELVQDVEEALQNALAGNNDAVTPQDTIDSGGKLRIVLRMSEVGLRDIQKVLDDMEALEKAGTEETFDALKAQVVRKSVALRGDGTPVVPSDMVFALRNAGNLHDFLSVQKNIKKYLLQEKQRLEENIATLKQALGEDDASV